MDSAKEFYTFYVLMKIDFLIFSFFDFLYLVNDDNEKRNFEEDEGLLCLKEAATFFKEILFQKEGELISKYLRKRMIPESMIEKFELGASLDGWSGVLNCLKQKKKSVKGIFKTGLIKYSKKSGRYYDTFRFRLMFPIKDIYGRCIGFGARSVKPEDEPKYLNSPETYYYRKNRVLYGLYEGLDSIRKLRRLIFVEGYLDVIRMHENGFTDVVATCGTALTNNHISIIKRYADTVILVFDGDLAGKKAALRLSHFLLPHALESFIVTLPEGEDPDTFLLNFGREGFEKLLNKKLPTIDYLVKHTIKKFPDSIQGRMQSLEELLPTLSGINDQKRKQLTLMAISERIKILPEIIEKELKKNVNKSLSNEDNNVKITRLSQNSNDSQDEQWLLQSLLRKGTLWPLVREYLIPGEFQIPKYQELYKKLLELPDSEFKPFDPLKLEKSDPKLFQSVMFLLTEEIERHDFGLSLLRIKERNLEKNYREWLLKSESNEDRAKIGLKRRKEEEKLKNVKKIFDDIFNSLDLDKKYEHSKKK